ncbi:TetR family transcriptional regulator [Nakamurella sp. YIM 132087]|uniref:TetR family transcriptional regulator n=1 Tax=Nakamurella alba TaxID=2665158 RepID=A0A7K1FSS9_9ACTN|nr:TetR family transcriptional regulator [Nakamurella alba]MTD17217.1 TetR family transcriptional regulator [Nakamurella alba]
MTGFQRARSAEQREVRRTAILATAAEMLQEMPVAELSLNALSRRVCLAKSNVLRYFESREAVLLELLTAQWADWLEELPGLLAAVPADAPVADRVERVAELVASAAAARPVLCDLLGAQAGVLERNLSPEVAAAWKRSSLTDATRLGAVIGAAVPELTDAAAIEAAAGVSVVAGALWQHTQPSAAMLEAYRAAPDLAAMKLDFAPALQEVLAVVLTGLLHRPPIGGGPFGMPLPVSITGRVAP